MASNTRLYHTAGSGYTHRRCPALPGVARRGASNADAGYAQALTRAVTHPVGGANPSSFTLYIGGR
ncbi:hypothetical protein [Serratia odorifera]|uniref:hypothetical protein n=1 Tax=Serratia odorifera TaxID=618 RepID=UPI0018E76CAD|nr:hypothetical protein [Serratia odorifera]MBJ2067803.1 hypothetical protein [Serratia odorifera]